MSEEVIRAWQVATADFITAVSDMPDWSVESACPGWSISDLVAHTIDLEAMLAEDPRPAHEIDVDAFVHVANDFGRVIEVGVDYRRGRSRDELLTELLEVHERAVQRITAMDPSETIAWLRGDTPRDTVVQMRTFDVWLHEQDARVVLGQHGNLDGPGARRALARLRAELPKLWAKSAPPHSVLHLIVTEPGIAFEEWISIDADGRGDFATATDAACTITMPWLTYVMLSGGRNTPLTNEVAITGDAALGQTFIGRLAVTP